LEKRKVGKRKPTAAGGWGKERLGVPFAGVRSYFSFGKKKSRQKKTNGGRGDGEKSVFGSLWGGGLLFFLKKEKKQKKRGNGETGREKIPRPKPIFSRQISFSLPFSLEKEKGRKEKKSAAGKAPGRGGAPARTHVFPLNFFFASFFFGKRKRKKRKEKRGGKGPGQGRGPGPNPCFPVRFLFRFLFLWEKKKEEK